MPLSYDEAVIVFARRRRKSLDEAHTEAERWIERAFQAAIAGVVRAIERLPFMLAPFAAARYASSGAR